MLDKVRKSVLNALGPKGLTMKKYGPTMLLGFGVGLSVSATVMTAFDTPQALEDVEKYKEEMAEIEEEFEDKDSDEGKAERVKKVLFTKGKLVTRLTNDYKWSILTEIGAIICVYISNQMIEKRLRSAVVAYGIVAKDFASYRKRAIEKYGDEVDKELKYGLKKETATVETVDENGNVQKTKEKLMTMNSKPSGYAVMFDMGTPGWSKSPEANMSYLKKIEKYCNDILRLRGYLFLNDVYDELEFPRTQDGQIVGWINDPTIKDQIDFGLFNTRWGSAFKHGLEPSVVLDFNVEGIIIDKLPTR